MRKEERRGGENKLGGEGQIDKEKEEGWRGAVRMDTELMTAGSPHH